MELNKQIKITKEIIIIFKNNNVKKIDAIGTLEVIKHNLLTGDL